ncbi:MAG: serine/threonine protein kinase [Candidatus Xenobia bacterium]
MLRPDSVVGGRYQVMRLLGEGASGRVWLVRDLKVRGARWALKELTPGSGDMTPQEAQALIAKEIAFLRSLRHPGLPSFVEVVEEKGIEYVVMERVEGLTLEQIRVNSGGRVRPEEAVKWCAQACNVLEYMHTRTPPIIFRDVKPSNLMLSAEGTVRLIDLGIARTYNPTRPGDTTLVGTPGYCPPEQYRGNTSPATDVYAVGATLFHLVTGEDPEKFKFKFPPLPHLVPEASLELDAVVSKALQLQPEARFPTAGELGCALSNVPPSAPLGALDRWLSRLFGTR